ncbi:MAG: hypothetical protein J6O71_06295 [Lachnospiraceae bacterium]|nr:hypothetical protein [Lachnospiraceae bacterium]
MVYYILSELKQAVKRKLCRNYFICIILMCLLANLAITVFRDLLYGVNDGTYAYNLIMFAKGFFWIPYYSCIFLADIVFGEKYPDPRIRNRSNVGLGRVKIYLGKLIAEWLLLLIFAVITTVLFLAITAVFQIHDGTIDSSVVIDFIKNVAYAFPLLMAGVSLSNMCLFLFDKKKTAYIAFALLVVLIPRVIMLLSTDSIAIAPMHAIRELLLTPQFQSLQFYATLDIPKIIISSVIYIIISSAVGCIRFCKKKW